MRILDAVKDPDAVEQLLRRQGGIDVLDAVRMILQDVRSGGDPAVLGFAARFDCPDIARMGMRVTPAEIAAAYRAVKPGFLRALRLAAGRIRAFHRRQRVPSLRVRERGVSLEQRSRPLDRVGIYVPGGKGVYFSTVLMNALPAAIAGVGEIVMATPCGREGRVASEVLVAGAECGITEIYRIGGAHAVAALAYGTATIPRVDKITGPGNAYVAAAKKLVFGEVGIDMIAGPTEVVVVGDGSAPVPFVAADLIAQAEHDEMATPLCITTSARLARRLPAELDRQLANAPRREIARKALDGQGAVVLVKSLAAAAELVNRFAPEHLELMVAKPREFAAKVRHAGAIFVGPWASEALGDYAAGPNHTLPTSGSARFSSPLSVLDFLKFTNIIEYDRRASVELAPVVELLAAAEGFYGHAASAAIRRTAR